MITRKDLENYFEKDFDDIIKDRDIIEIATDVDSAWDDYCEWEQDFQNGCDTTELELYLNNIKPKFYEWVQNATASELLEYEIDTYQRHFMLDGKVYYLDNYI